MSQARGPGDVENIPYNSTKGLCKDIQGSHDFARCKALPVAEAPPLLFALKESAALGAQSNHEFHNEDDLELVMAVMACRSLGLSLQAKEALLPAEGLETRCPRPAGGAPHPRQKKPTKDWCLWLLRCELG